MSCLICRYDMVTRYINFIVVPEDESGGMRFRLSTLSVKLIIGMVILLVASVVIMVIFYGRMLSSAVLVNELKRENKELKEYNSKVGKLEKELKDYRVFVSRVASLAGIDQDLMVEKKEPPNQPLSEHDSEIVYPIGPQKADVQLTDAPIGLPLGGWVSRGFSARHTGIDIAVKEGTEVKATADGIVKFVGWDETFGNLIILEHKGGFESYYGHNQKILVRSNQIIKSGEMISLSGNTGKSTAPHLHYEIKKDGKSVNPLGFIVRKT